MAKMTEERAWCLRWWSPGAWSIGRPNMRGIKKWERHIDMLTKAGLLETGGYDDEMRRLTDAGRAALNEAGE